MAIKNINIFKVNLDVELSTSKTKTTIDRFFNFTRVICDCTNDDVSNYNVLTIWTIAQNSHKT